MKTFWYLALAGMMVIAGFLLGLKIKDGAGWEEERFLWRKSNQLNFERGEKGEIRQEKVKQKKAEERGEGQKKRDAEISNIEKVKFSQEMNESRKKKGRVVNREVNTNEIISSEQKPTEPISWPVAFTSQAPTGRWQESVFQDGCEEATMLMAINWARDGNQPLSPQKVEQVLRELADYEKRDYDIDLSLADVAAVIRDYFQYRQLKLIDNPSLNELVQGLQAGAVIIAPTNGRLLKNPFFTPPGPLYHMVLIVGYDPQTREFIVNDPGTRRGDHYRYPEEVLMSAIRDYPTGHHEPIVQQEKRVLFVFHK